MPPSKFLLLLLYSLLSAALYSVTAKGIKVPSDIVVVEEPGEDDCDYANNYLWQILANEVSTYSIDYYDVCFDITR